MKTRSVTQVARHFRETIDSIEKKQEEIILTRNGKRVVRLIPEAPPQNALEVFGDLYRTLDEKTIELLSSSNSANQKSRHGRLSELKNPWTG